MDAHNVNNKHMTQELYHFAHIRELLTQGFSDQELRNLCFDVPGFRPVYEHIGASTSKAEIITQLLEHAEKTLQVDTLLALAKELNPARYEVHQPYYLADSTPALQKQLASLARQFSVSTKKTGGEIVTPPLPAIQAKLVIMVAALAVIVVVVIMSVQSYLSGKSSIEATRIALAKLTDTPHPTKPIALTSIVPSTTSTPSVTPRPTLIFPTRTPIVATATTTSTGRMWQNWTQVQSFPAPAAKPSLIVRQDDILWVAAGSRLYQLNLEGDIISEMKFPGSCANAAWDGEMLWCGSASSVYRRDFTSEQQWVSFTVDIDPIVALAWDGEALWVIDGDGNLARYDKTGQRRQRVAVSAGGREIIDMMWVEGEFWLIDDYSKSVTRLDSKFNRLGWFPLCGVSYPYNAAFFWDGNNLWVANSSTNRISQCTPND